ncbi:MAG: YciI family protein [Burkholderiales bacterium]
MNTTPKRSTLALLAGLLLAPAAVLYAHANERRQQFIYILRVAPRFQDVREWTDKEAAVVARHFERLSKATAEGQVILAGRTTEGLDATFGIVVFEAETLDQARAFMQSDPVVAAGLMSATLHPYAVALQRRPRVE